MILPLEYYQQEDVVFLSRDLIGKCLFTNLDGEITGGVITETEAYRGPEDRASHAFGYRRTKRNEVMYLDGGISYVYFCYGIHYLFNIVTNRAENPHAILIRSIQPFWGIEVMLKRRKKVKSQEKGLAIGPGNVCQALGIDRRFNGIALNGPLIWVEDKGIQVNPKKIFAGPRVGVDYAGEDAHLPWRFQYKEEIKL